jgi:hypothetical protein
MAGDGAGADQFYIANVATLYAVSGYRPSVLVVTSIQPPVPIAMQCSTHGSTD